MSGGAKRSDAVGVWESKPCIPALVPIAKHSSEAASPAVSVLAGNRINVKRVREARWWSCADGKRRLRGLGLTQTVENLRRPEIAIHDRRSWHGTKLITGVISPIAFLLAPKRSVCAEPRLGSKGADANRGLWPQLGNQRLSW